MNSKKPHFHPPVGAVSNRTAEAQLETVPTKRVSFSGFPVFPFSLIRHRTGLACLINSNIHYKVDFLPRSLLSRDGNLAFRLTKFVDNAILSDGARWLR